MLKKRGDILLHMCTTNEDHMIYGSWDIRHNGQSFLSFWAIFYPLTLLTIWKIKILKKWKRKKTSGDTKLFTLVYHKWPLHDVWYLRYGARQTGFFVILDIFGTWNVTDAIVIFHFGPILCPLPFALLQSPSEKSNFKIKWKKTLEISLFYTSIPKSWSYAILFLRYGVWRM